jgi:AcrR family transcriptional regulator
MRTQRQLRAVGPTDPLRDRIVHEATTLFSELGVGATSMRMIAERLGVTKAALYYHFESKEQLHFEIHLALIDEVLDQLEQIASGDEPPADQVRAVVRLILHSVADHRDAFTILLREGAGLTGPPWNELTEKRARFRGRVKDIVSAGMAAGDIVTDDAEVATLALLGMCNWTYTWIEPDGRLTVGEIADRFASIFLQGVQR